MARTKRYPGSIRRRGSTWQVRLHVAGERHTFTADGTRTEAENFATTKAQELEEKAQRQREGRPAMLRFSALLTDFETNEFPDLAPGTRGSYRTSFAPFHLFFVEQMGNPELSGIRRSDIKRYLAWRRSRRIVTEGEGEGKRFVAVEGEGVSRHTVARDLRVLRRLFNYAVELDVLDANPTAKVKAPKADPRTPHILTADEYDRLLEECEGRPMLWLFVLICGETGARSLSEVLRLRWEDVDLAGGFVQIRSRAGGRTKSGKSRWAPMSPRLREALQEHAAGYRLALYEGGRSPWLFHHTHSRTGRKAGERITNLRRAFHAATARAQVPHIRVHDLRHRRVTTWLAEGKPAALVQEVMGHASFATTQGYQHLAREHLRVLVDDPPQRSAQDVAKNVAKRP